MFLQVFSLSMTNELRREEGCLDTRGGEGDTVSLMPCHNGRGNQEWTYRKVLSDTACSSLTAGAAYISH